MAGVPNSLQYPSDSPPDRVLQRGPAHGRWGAYLTAERATGSSIDYSIIIPVFNEGDNVALLHEKLAAATASIASLEIIFVDDGSSDAGFKILSDIAAHSERVKVIRLSRNFGKTAAMSAGFDASRGRIIINMDADLQDDPAEIPNLLAKLDEGFDFV